MKIMCVDDEPLALQMLELSVTLRSSLVKTLKQRASTGANQDFTRNAPGRILSAMETKNKKTKYGLTRDQERAASRFFGRHVSPEKALASAVAATLCCLAPILLGLRLWDGIPAMVQTGLIGPEGKDDSLPRAVLVYGVPGLFAVLTLICHGQLWLHQRSERVPPTPVRLLGRWTIPVLAVTLSPFWPLRAAARTVTGADFVPCFFALLLLLVGERLFDCTREQKLAFHFKRIEYKERAWRVTHRWGGGAWMAAGLMLLAVRFAAGRLPWYTAVLTAALLTVPFPAAALAAKRES